LINFTEVHGKIFEILYHNYHIFRVNFKRKFSPYINVLKYLIDEIEAFFDKFLIKNFLIKRRILLIDQLKNASKYLQHHIDCIHNYL